MSLPFSKSGFILRHESRTAVLTFLTQACAATLNMYPSLRFKKKLIYSSTKQP